MDVHPNAAAAAAAAAVSGNIVDDFLPCETLAGGDGVSLEWLSIFVEDCLNGGGFACQPPLPTPTPAIPSQAQQLHAEAQRGPSSASNKATRTKRRKVHASPYSDPPPLLPRAYWLADSRPLTFPKEEEGEEEEEEKGNGEEGQGPRRCTHCWSYKTPQWRAGPKGPKTLCNACGVRYKSGRLLPEYRPAKSPTFESFKHSNSHKRVMEMRTMSTLLPSDPSL